MIGNFFIETLGYRTKAYSIKIINECFNINFETIEKISFAEFKKSKHFDFKEDGNQFFVVNENGYGFAIDINNIYKIDRNGKKEFRVPSKFLIKSFLNTILQEIEKLNKDKKC
ncbi:hypothetical protein PJV92_11520 [Aliarcobacter butzleri]|uniref:Uncharacterized protein n=1 Tax=Aliarcobacter butzleri TaxID=28197 RepID=A0AAP4Q0H3_9BACT|nr:hypothetical protein [Aliarcobacter butzleri]MDN5051370.1 hypothetical protein [Aliarcobacter butzleri]MDN5074199.1 hypothetical protein [Aliarcobacter butzleri]MDN5115616.1 hypothetical protein [Aliarcobacter butzleri]MDN5133348.1 hypothetical protein [Aliarcobacter butzleri]